MSDLVRVTRGVWRPRLVADDFAGRLAALLSAYPDDTVVCGRTAARLHGLWLPTDGREEDVVELIVHPGIAIPSQRSASYRGQVRARRQMLAVDEVVTLDGILITSEARTWLDLAEVLGPADLVACGDSALRGTASLDEIDCLIRRAAHRRGVVLARAMLPLLDGRSRSRPESHLRYTLVSGGLPKPEVNKPIYNDNGEWLAEPDLSYADVRLALEYNGADHAKVERMRRDLTRGVDVSVGRWRTEAFGPTQVFQRPDQIVALVRQLRRERATITPAPVPLSGDKLA